MRLPRAVKTLVQAAAAVPLLAFLVPSVFMLGVALGLWDRVAPFLDTRSTESIGWSLLFAVGLGLGSLQLCLTVFCLLHIARATSVSTFVRTMFAGGILLVPLLAMPVYCLLFVLPDQPDPQRWSPRQLVDPKGIARTGD